MRDASRHPLTGDNQERWQQHVQLSRGHWRREDAAGAIRSTGWWESVTVTWSPAPAPDRRPAMLQRALAAAADMIAPVLADVAVASTRRLLQRRHHRLLVASLLRRQLAPAAGSFPGQIGHREGGPGHAGSAGSCWRFTGLKPVAIATRR
jgi:hypothetical protein